MYSSNLIIPLAIQLLTYSPQSLLLPIQVSSYVYKTYKWFYPTQPEPIIYVVENIDCDNNDFTLVSKVSF